MDIELLRVLLFGCLLIVPKALQCARIPGPLTCLALGVAAVPLMLPQWDIGPVHFAATLGISSLFLHAGLEVDPAQLRQQSVSLGALGLVRVLGIAVVAAAAAHWLAMTWQAAVLLALAVLTSSTGFILDSLDRFVLNDKQRSVIANEAISGELLALTIMFLVLQSANGTRLALSLGAMGALLVALPLAYIALVRWVVPHAPGSQFSLLMTVAVLAAFATERLGAELLLGAFIAGVIAAQLGPRVPALLPADTAHALKLFSSFFLPFYFFRNGALIPAGAFSLEAAGIGLLLCLFIPLRALATWVRRRMAGDVAADAAPVAVALLPTVIFTLVLASILRSQFGISDALYGGLLLYACVNTLLPSLLLRVGLDEPLSETPAAQGPPRQETRQG